MKSSLSLAKTRNSSIELLRILAMFFVVISHYSFHGQLNFSDTDLIFNAYLLRCSKLGNLGVDIFIIISGYFLINSKFSLNKWLKLVFQVLFYSIIIYTVFTITGMNQFKLLDFVFSLLPTITKQYWFFTAYIALYLVHPFINVMLKNFSKKQFFTFLCVAIFIWSIIPTFILRYDFYGNEMVQFVLLYSLGAFLRINPINSKKETKMSYVFIAASGLCSVLIMILEQKLSVLKKLSIDLFGRNSIFIILVAVGLFMLFKNFNIGEVKFINNISKCTFGVYLIHDNNYVRKWLWNDVFPNGSYVNSYKLVLHLIVSVVIVYVVCTAIEYIRITIFEKPVFKLLNRPINSVEIKLKTAFSKVYIKINKLLYS